MKRGDIWLVQLNSTLGSEIRKARPCVIVSPDELNERLCTVMVAPMTSKGFVVPFRVPVIHADINGLIVLDQTRSVDKGRPIRPLGQLSPQTLADTLKTLQDIFAP